MSTPGSSHAVLENLKRLTHPRRADAEHCELCSAPLAAEHPHLLNVSNGGIICSCDACAILFPGRADQKLRRIPRDIRLLRDFSMSDAQWNSLNIPIELAFFCRRGSPARPVAYYPSPAGAVESLLDFASWEKIAGENRALAKLEDEVEALLVNRATVPHDYYLVPIDECYRLVGLIRSRWRGLSGGREAWQAIGMFFISLRAKADSGGAHA